MALFNANGKDVIATIPAKFHNKEEREHYLSTVTERHVLQHKHAGKFFKMEERAIFKGAK